MRSSILSESSFHKGICLGHIRVIILPIVYNVQVFLILFLVTLYIELSFNVRPASFDSCRFCFLLYVIVPDNTLPKM